MKQVKSENPAFTNMKKLGFGLMRLPKCEDDPKKIDVPQVLYKKEPENQR